MHTISASSVETLRAPSRHLKECDGTTTVMHDVEYQLSPPRLFFIATAFCSSTDSQGNEVYGGDTAGIFLHRSSDDATVRGEKS